MKELKAMLNLSWWDKEAEIDKLYCEAEIGDSYRHINIKDIIKDKLSVRSVMCSRCGETYNASLETFGVYKTRESEGDSKTIELVLRCGNQKCGKFFTILIPSVELINELDLTGENHKISTIPATSYTDSKELSQWKSAGIPELAIEAFGEGCRSMGNELYRAACAMFRVCLEKILEDRYKEDYKKGGSLYGNIENLGLSEIIKEMSHAVREIGNDHVHFNFEIALEEKARDAEDALTIIRTIADKLYLEKYADYTIAERIKARDALRFKNDN